jgi:hypothetical protein
VRAGFFTTPTPALPIPAGETEWDVIPRPAMSLAAPIGTARKLASGVRRLAAYPSLRSQLPLIEQESARLDAEEIGNGWLRGVDFYPRDQLAQVLTRVFVQFHAAHAHYPDLIHPRGFNEWIVRSNFLRPMKIPESGNKLSTSWYIPGRMLNQICCPKILWSGMRLNWADLDQLVPGQSYYLKAAHGSGMCRRFTWPLDECVQLELSAISAQWLQVRYGLTHGEWWYNTFPPSLLIETDVGGNGFSVNCFCFKGRVGLVVLHSKSTGETVTLGERLEFIGQKNGHSSWCSLFEADVLREIREIASELSRETEFARLDFLVDASNRIFLGEVTFAPGNGTSKRPEGVDERLGKMWSDSARS